MVAVIVALEIIARYEALFRAMNFHRRRSDHFGAGGACICASGDGRSFKDDSPVIAKIEGRVLTVMVLRRRHAETVPLRRARRSDRRQILAVLQPTFAYVEDELAAPAQPVDPVRIPSGALGRRWKPTETLRSSLGAPGAFNAGLLGYLEGARNLT